MDPRSDPSKTVKNDFDNLFRDPRMSTRDGTLKRTLNNWVAHVVVQIAHLF